MSDAQGPRNEPRDGEPIEDAAAPAPAETSDATDTGDIPASRREARVSTGPTDVVHTPVDDSPVEEPAAPAATAPDYAALAADLDDLEARGASTTVTTRSADADADAAPAAGGSKPDPWFEPADKTQTFTATDAYEAPASPAITASEPVAPEPPAHVAPAAPVQQQLPVFVQAPEPPRLKGNRGASGAIGLVAALVFAILYFAAKLGIAALAGEVTVDGIADWSLETVMSLGFWTTVVVFFLGFWFLGTLVNRARWAAWVLLGVFVALIAWAGHIAGALVDAPFWQLTASEAVEEVGRQLLSPLAIAAFVFAREITIWFGAWVSRRGAKVTTRNAEAQAEYERTLADGPKLG